MKPWPKPLRTGQLLVCGNTGPGVYSDFWVRTSQSGRVGMYQCLAQHTLSAVKSLMYYAEVVFLLHELFRGNSLKVL